MNPVEHFVSKSAQWEYCGMCARLGGWTVAATHKVGEEIPRDAKNFGHYLTQYVCCAHFGQIIGQQSAIAWRGCSVEELVPVPKAEYIFNHHPFEDSCQISPRSEKKGQMHGLKEGE